MEVPSQHNRKKWQRAVISIYTAQKHIEITSVAFEMKIFLQAIEFRGINHQQTQTHCEFISNDTHNKITY